MRRKVQPGGQSIPVVVLANKGDITTKTIPSQIDDYCKNQDILAWYITSAKNNINIGNINNYTNLPQKNRKYVYFSLLELIEKPIQLIFCENCFILDEAMIRLSNAAIQNHYGSQIPLIVDDTVRLNERTPHQSNRKYNCC